MTFRKFLSSALLLSLTTVAIKLEAATIYVDETSASPSAPYAGWNTAAANLQDALAAAISGDEIWVANGTYYPDEGGDQTNNDRNATFSLKNGVSIYGGFAGGETLRSAADPTVDETILSGEIDQVASINGNSYHVLSASFIEDPTVLQGVTIQLGNADGVSAPLDSGGALYIQNATSNLSIVTCLFTNNNAVYGGAIHNVNSSPTITDCTFQANTATARNGIGGYGGAMHNFTASDPQITDCTFASNTGLYGGAILNEISVPTIERSTFSSNTAGANGGAIHNFRGSPAIIADCAFSLNTAVNFGGAIINQINSSTTIRNCSFVSNISLHGAGIYNQSSDPTITDCSFSGNRASSLGGAINNSDESAPNITNVSFSSNQASWGGAMVNDTSSKPQIRNGAFFKNVASVEGGAIFNQRGGYPLLVNATFYGNVAANNGGAISDSLDSTHTLINSIVWANEAAGFTNTQNASIYSKSSIEPRFTASLVENYTAADLDASGVSLGGNFPPDDPGFVSYNPSTLEDLRLLGSSPGVNEGAIIFGQPSTDLAGNPRVLGSKIDLGPFEGGVIFISGWETGGYDPTGNLPDSRSFSVNLPSSLWQQQFLPFNIKETLKISKSGSADHNEENLVIYDTPFRVSITLKEVTGEGSFILEFDEAIALDQGFFIENNIPFRTPFVSAVSVSPTHYVNAANDAPAVPYDTWETAATNLQDALAVAAAGDEIWVAAGTYYPDQGEFQTLGDRTATFQLLDNIAIYGGFLGDETDRSAANPAANETILSGNLGDTATPDDNSYHVVTADGNAVAISSSAILDGFTITAGNANGTGPNQERGSALYTFTASPTLTNLTFQANSATFGGAIYNRSASPTFTNCAFEGNKATNGGAIYTYASTATFINCSFQGNHASTQGGAIFFSSSTTSLTNCIIWSNAQANVTTLLGASIASVASATTYANCLVENIDLSSTGTGNLDGTDPANDPRFVLEVDPLSAPATGANLRLSGGSPAIDAGNNDANTTTTDLAGNRRIQNVAIDLGAYEGTIVEFAEPEVERAVRFTLNVPPGPITAIQMGTLDSLVVGGFAGSNPISDLSGLEYAVNLTSLSLSRNQIVDLSPIAKLKTLRSLWLNDNQIADLTPISGLTNLENLNLAGNALLDVSPLGQLNNLFNLDLSNNPGVNVNTLAGVNSLTSFRLERSQIDDLSPLAEMTLLEELSLEDNQIVDPAPLSGLTKLQILRLGKNQIADLASLSGLTALQTLDITDNQIVNIAPLSGLTTLENLFLPFNQISDIQPLSALTTLRELELFGNQVVSLEPLSGLTALYYLQLNDNQIIDLAPLSGLTALAYLYLDDNQIVDLSPLSELAVNSSLYVRTNPGLILYAGSPQQAIVDALIAAEVKVFFDAGVAPPLLSSYLSKIDQPATSINIDVTTFGDWTVTEDADWLSADSEQGVGNATIVITATANHTANLRTANVLFNDEIHVVRQRGLLESADPDFTSWLASYFTAEEIAAMQPNTAQADSDRDSLSNFDEWKLGLDPTEFAWRLRTTLSIGETTTTLKVSPIPEGVEIGFQSSSNLVDWLPVLASPVRDGTTLSIEVETPATSLFLQILLPEDPDEM